MPRHPKPWYRKSHKCWFVTIGGVQHNLGRDKKAANELFHQLMRQPQQRKVSPESLAALADAFLEWTHRNRSEATYQWYRDRLQRFLRHYPDLNVARIKPYHVELWAAEGERTINTRRNLMRAVKRCLKWAKVQGYIEENPIEGLEIPSAIAKEVFISPEEFSTLLANVSNKQFAELLRVTYEIGCRPQESLRVEARHIDLEHSRWIFPASESKGKRSPRIIYLTDDAVTITARLLERNAQGILFRNSHGKPWTPCSIGCQFSRLQTRMGRQIMAQRGEILSESDVSGKVKKLNPYRTVHGKELKKTRCELVHEARRKLTEMRARELAPRYSLYALRHSWATNALQKVDALTVAILMGHKDPSTLARTYQHLSHNPEHLLLQARRAAG